MTTLSLKMLSAFIAASSHGPQNNQEASKPGANRTRCAIIFFAPSTIFSFVPCCGSSPGADTLGFLLASFHSFSLRKTFVPRYGVRLVRS